MIALTHLSLTDYRCFAQTPDLSFASINVFIGPNNAGKSTLLSAIELLLRSSAGPHGGEPLDFSDQAQFSSFTSVLRKHWAPREPKHSQVVIDAEWSSAFPRPGGLARAYAYWSKFILKGAKAADRTFVSSAEYGTVLRGERQPTRIAIFSTDEDTAQRYDAKVLPPDRSLGRRPRVYFEGLLPLILPRTYPARRTPQDRADLLDYTFQARLLSRQSQLVVVRPHRPVPRPLYVLDDPSLGDEDRLLISSLVDLWTRKDTRSDAIRKQVVDSIRTMNLAKHLSVVRSLPSSPSIVQIRVSTGSTRNMVTIADVGFGLSQVLPLVAKDASLSSGYLLSYQPEVHLHPFAQSRLADIFAASASRNNVVFVETHSEHIVLRLQYLIATKVIPEASVRIFCAEPKGHTSTIRPMTFDAAGRPTSAWPQGFLDTNLQLARELAAARNGG